MPALEFDDGGGPDYAMEDAPNGLGEPKMGDGQDSRDDGSSLMDDGDLIIDEYASDDDNEAFIKSLSNQAELPTGCCYDDRMKLHANADFGPSPHHPEDPRRIEEIMKIFKKAGIVYTGPDSELIDILAKTPNKFMYRVPARDATKQEILTVHTEVHYDWCENLSTMSTEQLRNLSAQLDQGRASLYVGAMSFEAALLAAGGAIETCKNIVAGKLKNGFAVIRPPGHHAEYDTAMGFCLFNNVPVAAKVCQVEYPGLCRKILILDWDVHHGNGIQNMFYEDPNILYISIHVYKNGDFYPGKSENELIPDGGIDRVGDGYGQGKNVNIGWAAQGMGDAEYLAAFQKIVMPIAQEFGPDLVIVSAGFDAADGDDLGGCFVTPDCYAHMTHMLMSLANGKVAVCLEGGYNLKAISQSALSVARTLMGQPPPKMSPLAPMDKDAARVLAKVQAVHAPYWQCMRPGVIDMAQLNAGTNRLHDVVRGDQRQKLSEKFNMIPLYIQREALYKSFENQVLVSPQLSAKRRILFIIHDPPSLVASPDLLDNSIDSHNAFVSDSVYPYIEWAHLQGFGVIDVNVPKYITRPEDTEAFEPRAGEKELSAQIMELAYYIWDNYLQLHDADDIFLMGVGNAYLGVKLLLTGRSCKERIAGVVNFVDGSLRPIKSSVDEDLSSWYKKHSLIYVGTDHACWSDPDLAKRVKKSRYGNVQRSTRSGIQQMMAEHAGTVFEWISARVSSSGNTTEDEKMV